MTQKQLKQLRKLAHHKKVVVIIGQHGLTDNVILEVSQALETHELLKIRVNANDRDERNTMIDRIAEQTQSDIIQRIGHVAVLYREAQQ